MAAAGLFLRQRWARWPILALGAGIAILAAGTPRGFFLQAFAAGMWFAGIPFLALAAELDIVRRHCSIMTFLKSTRHAKITGDFGEAAVLYDLLPEN